MPRLPSRRRRLRSWVAIPVVVVVAAYGLVLGLISESIVAPPRVRIADSARPAIGVVLHDRAGGEVVIRRTVDPARASGLRGGDVLVRIDDRDVSSAGDIVRAVASASAGDLLRIEARRRGPDEGPVAVLVDVPVVVRPITPADAGLPWVDVAFTDRHGRLLRGWYVPPPDGVEAAPGVVYAHGNASDRRQWLNVAWAMHRAGMAQLLFDFAGRGESEGATITLGPQEAEGVRAAVDDLAGRPEVDGGRIAVVGKSLGAVAAILAGPGDARIRALVLDSPFADLVATIDHNLRQRGIPPALVRGPLLALVAIRARYEPRTVRPVDAMRAVEVPVLLLHGTEDRLVPFGNAEALAAAAPDVVRLVPLPGSGHNDPRPADLDETIRDFLSVALATGRAGTVTQP